MKKLIITAACVAAAVSGFAQGTVQFNNSISTVFDLATYSSPAYTTITGSNKVTSATIAAQASPDSSGPGASTGVIDVGLFWSTSTFNTVGGGTLAGIEQISSTAAGQLIGNPAFGISGTTALEPVYLQVFAWDNSYGDSQQGAENALAAGGYFGATTAGIANTTYGAIGSAISSTLGQPPPADGTLIFSTTAGYFGKTILLAQSTPEPATLALGGLGAAALLLFRRRK